MDQDDGHLVADRGAAARWVGTVERRQISFLGKHEGANTQYLIVRPDEGGQLSSRARAFLLRAYALENLDAADRSGGLGPKA